MEYIVVKFAIYILSSIIVVYSIDAININAIFKKNRVAQARVFYLVLVLSLIYLLSNLLYDFIYLKLF